MAARQRPAAGEPVTKLKQVSLFTPQRIAILDAIRAAPGISLSDLSRRFKRDTSTIDGHLRHLKQAGLVVQERDGKRVALYLNGEFSARERLIARLGDGAEILALVQEGKAKSPAEIAKRLGISRHKTRGQLERLARLGFLREVETQVLVRELRYVADYEDATAP